MEKIHLPSIHWSEEFAQVMCKYVPSINPQKKKRIDYIDLAKGICILLVVFHHVALLDHDLEYPLKNTMKMFRMPLYFTLSGLFFKSYSGYLDFTLRKTNKLLIPYMAFYLLGVLLSDKNGAIWFLLCLFIINLIFYGLYELSKLFHNKYQVAFLVASTLIVGCGGYILGINGIVIPPYVTTAMTALPFFSMGFVLRKFTEILQKNSFDHYMWLVAAALFVVCWFLSGYVNYRKNIYEVDPFSLYMSGFCGVMGVLFLSKSIVRIPILSYCGRYSIIILVTHMAILHAFSRPAIKLMVSIGASHITAVLFFTLFLMTCYVIIIPVVKTYFPHITAQKDVIPIRG